MRIVLEGWRGYAALVGMLFSGNAVVLALVMGDWLPAALLFLGGGGLWIWGARYE